MNELEDLKAFMRDFTPPPRLELHCGRAAWDVMRSGMKADPMGTADPLYGIPVNINPEFADGAWQLTKDGEVVSSGDYAPGHKRAFYVSGVGLIGASDEAAEIIDGNLADLVRRADEHTEECGR